MEAKRWREVEQLYNAVIELSPEKRSGFLTQACGRDEQLRQEVESLLTRDGSNGPLDRPIAKLLSESNCLQPGSRLDRFQIEALLGSGGMGEVYKAQDTRLRRAVAIKVSTQPFTDRFEREARAVAALNHPNICTLHDVGSNYLVMELVEGPTLADRIKRGALPLDEALTIVRQIGAALEVAHEKGIIHCDLKPGNIKFAADGTVKVLDFGLAKVVAPDGDRDEMSTITMEKTREGVVIGTAAYMSPEQARGKPLDKRTDIWAFGVVLYEMVTGKRLFRGDDVSETLAAVIKEEPRWDGVPTKVRRLLESCLTKDPQRRLRDIGDAWRLLDDNPQSPPSVRKLPWVLAAVLGVMLVAVAAMYFRVTRPVEKPLVRLDLNLGEDVAEADISPDGKQIVYQSHAFQSQQQLLVRDLDQPTSTVLAGAQGAIDPFFSPDGKWVGFFTLGKLKKVSIDSGTVVVLCDAEGPHAGADTGASWGEDGNIIASLYSAGGLYKIPAVGGQPVPITNLENGEVTHRWPQILPGGKAVLFTAHNKVFGDFDNANIKVMSLKDRHQRIVLAGGSFARYVPSGHLLFVKGGALFAVPFDLGRLEAHGSPVRLLNVDYSGTTGGADFRASHNGTLLYTAPRTGRQVTVQWLDESGRMRPLISKPGLYANPRLSQDGQRLAMRITGSSGVDLWVYDWKRDAMTRVTDGSGSPTNPLWTPDGQYILFWETQSGNMYWTRADGAAKPKLLMPSSKNQEPYSFTSDSKRLAFMQAGLEGWDIWTVPIQSDAKGLHAGEPEPFLETPFDERHPSFSPDGRWLAYASNESGIFEVYVRPFGREGGKWQVSNSGGLNPRWSRTGHELFYQTEDLQIMVASYAMQGDSFVPGKPRIWFGGKLATLSGPPVVNYDLAPDGKHVAAFEYVGGSPDPMHFVFVENFFDELRRRVRP